VRNIILVAEVPIHVNSTASFLRLGVRIHVFQD
jgi:hypothetical protein